MSALVVERSAHATLIGFARPEKRNALDRELVAEIHSVLSETSETPGVLIFHSTTPGVFVSGADIVELRDRTAEDAMRRINGELFDRIARHRWPTIAAIDGPALGGGCELALACDFRIATPSARFAQPEAGLGIMAAAGGNWRLERLAGLSVARRMLLAGESLDAAEALRSGLADRVADADSLLAEAEDLASRIARSSWRALELTKLALSMHEPPAAPAFEAAAQALLFESDEKRQRMDRFLERKRRGDSR